MLRFTLSIYYVPGSETRRVYVTLRLWTKLESNLPMSYVSAPPAGSPNTRASGKDLHGRGAQGCAKGCCCCLVTKSCPTLCKPMDYNLPGSSGHGTSQARILEWVAIPFSRGSSWPRDRTRVSCTSRRVLHCGATWAFLQTCLVSFWAQTQTGRKSLYTYFSLYGKRDRLLCSSLVFSSLCHEGP